MRVGWAVEFLTVDSSVSVLFVKNSYAYSFVIVKIDILKTCTSMIYVICYFSSIDKVPLIHISQKKHTNSSILKQILHLTVAISH